MKIGVSSYSFNRYFRNGDMVLADMVRSASEIGFTGFEMLPWYFVDGESSPEKCRELKNMLADASLDFCCYTLATNFALPEGPDRQAVIDRVKLEIDMAVLMGVDTMRIESTFGPKEGEEVELAEMLDRVIKGTKQVAQHALALGVRLGLENHGRYMGSFTHVAHIIKEVNSPAYGAVPDIGNFLVVDEDPLVACRELAKSTIHVHAKDFVRKPPEPAMGKGWSVTNGGNQIQGAVVGEGDVPVRECIAAFKECGYDGYLAVEHESPDDPIEGLKRSRANLEEMISSLS